MSDYFSKLEYHALRTPKGQPVGRIRKIMPQQERIGFFDEARKSVWIFTYEGEYVNEVRIPEGRGPGEIEHLSDVLFTKEDLIYALGLYKIVVYNTDGKFIEETKFKTIIRKFIYVPETQEYIGYADNSLNEQMANEHAGHNLIAVNKEGTFTKSFIPVPNGREYMGYIVPNNFPTYQEEQLFFSHLSDTVYTVYADSVKPRYILDYGEDTIPEEVFDRRGNYSDVFYEWVDFSENELEAKGYISFLTFFNETNSYIYANLGSHNITYTIMYNKVTKETVVGPSRFTNDIDYNYVPFIYESDDHALYTIIEAYDFLTNLNEIYKNEPQKYRSPQMQSLINIAHSLDENSNPVLQIATFRDNK